MGYRLGVDLGTTYTAAAANVDGRVELLGLGIRAMQVPSVVYVRPDGELIVGEAAEQRGAADGSRLVREFKRRIGDAVPLVVGGSPFSAQALSAKLLAWVVEKATERLGGPPEHVCVTHPANWGQFKRDLLTQAIEMAGLKGTATSTCTEPEAAAIAYASRDRVREGDRVAVYDLGGGTFDAAVLVREGAGFRLLGPPEGVEHLGGIDFDEAVFRHVLAALGDEAAGLDDTDPVTATALARLRRDCVEAKEVLSSSPDTDVPVVLPGVATTSVRLTRDEFEDMLRPAIGETVSAMRRVLQSAEVSAADVTAMVLVGGSSRIPLVSEMLSAAFARPLALDNHPKHDVALGAAIRGTPAAQPPARPTDDEVAPPPDRAAAGVGATGPAWVGAGRDGGDRPQTAWDGAGGNGAPVGGAAPAGATGWVAGAGLPGAPVEPQPATVGPPPPGYGGFPGAAPFAAGPGPAPPGPFEPGPSGPPPGPAPDWRPPDAVGPAPSRPGPSGPVRESGPGGVDRRRILALVGVFVVAVVAAGGVLYATTGRTPPPPPPQPPRTAVASPTPTPSPVPTAVVPALPQAAEPLADDVIVWPRKVGDNWDITTVSADGTVGAPLTNSPAEDNFPLISPDRRTIVYLHRTSPQTREVRVMGADGSDDRALFATPPAGCADLTRPAFNGPDLRLVLPCLNPTTGATTLTLVDVDGTVLRVVDQGAVSDPAMAPDGTAVVYWKARRSGEDGGELWRASLDGSQPPGPVTRDGRDNDAAVSPVGDVVAFTRSGQGIWTVGLGAGNPARQLTKRDGDMDPSFSPDGARITFKRSNQMWIMNADGSDVRRITDPGDIGTAAAWSPR